MWPIITDDQLDLIKKCLANDYSTLCRGSIGWGVYRDYWHVGQQNEIDRPNKTETGIIRCAYCLDVMKGEERESSHTFPEVPFSLNKCLFCFCCDTRYGFLQPFSGDLYQRISKELPDLQPSTGAASLIPLIVQFSPFWVEQLLDPWTFQMVLLESLSADPVSLPKKSLNQFCLTQLCDWVSFWFLTN